jgi:hypothetical protein
VQSVELAAIADRCTVDQAAAGAELRSLPGLAVEMAADPRLAVAQEVVDQALGVSPASTRRERRSM